MTDPTAQFERRDSESEDLSVRAVFDHLLTFPDEIAPVFNDLGDEQRERRKLDQVRVDRNIMYIDRLNEALDVDIKERIESDQLIEKLNISRLDTMQRKLVFQIEAGYKALQEELDDAKERLRVATEKLYQTEVDAEIQLAQMREYIMGQMDLRQEELLYQSQVRVQEDLELRQTFPAPVLEVWRVLADEKDVMEGVAMLARERCLPLEHSDLNDIENSVAQKTIREEISELVTNIEKETRERIEEEKAQAAKTRALTDMLSRGLKVVNRNYYA
eukprot:CAMPEP_0184322866 /NCGR_PEP_ID=MMETSP1049-20130417/127021_1 /TAXON_ID=77928 /ORGANISM="Proteomonas sulcata, Strain CCMP704" /LENGTH=273 /DNA_ID=CAMNT_0026644151 /DNA_START=51 /DNA_END=869 /DNA_ORIENTATION=-